MKQKIKQTLMATFFLLSGVIFAQVKTVNGTVTDSDGVPLPGASIVLTDASLSLCAALLPPGRH